MNKRIYNYCIHLLARQDYSEFKLRRKLSSKPDNLPEEIDTVINELKSAQLLNEDRYKRLFIKKWISKKESHKKIIARGKMEQLNILPEEVKQIQQELGVNSDDSIRSLIQKKLRQTKPQSDPAQVFKLRDKVLRFLISKGHGFDEAKTALDSYLKESYQV